MLLPPTASDHPVHVESKLHPNPTPPFALQDETRIMFSHVPHGQKILLVGESNFRFAEGLAAAMADPSKLIVTCLEKERRICRRQPSLWERVEILRRVGVKVVFSFSPSLLEVISTSSSTSSSSSHHKKTSHKRGPHHHRMSKSRSESTSSSRRERNSSSSSRKEKEISGVVSLKEGDRIPWHDIGKVIWHFPSSGHGDDFARHQKMFSRFFSCISRRFLLHPEQPCEVLLTLVDDQFSRWQVERSARDAFFFLRRCVPFEASAFPGYQYVGQDGVRTLSARHESIFAFDLYWPAAVAANLLANAA